MIYLLMTILLSSSSMAQNTCVSLFNVNQGDHLFQIIPSGRDSDTVPLYRDVARVLYKDGGVLDQLGIPKSKQLIQFFKGTDLNAVAKAGTGGFPISHYLDGSEILKAYNDTRSLIFEVVYPGPEYQHAFYRDDNKREQQISIIYHVIGHNDFANTSFLKGYRGAQTTDVSLQLDKLMNRLYSTENKDEVMRWYLFMQSLLPLQDFHSGFYQDAVEFTQKTPQQRDPDYRKKIQLGEKIETRHPSSPTENVLQAFVGNIPGHLSPWKKTVAEHMAHLVTFQTALVRTQVMNEGWATFMQQILAKHSGKYNTFEHYLEAASLMNVEKDISLRDPYWLGVNAWRRLYEKFRERPEIKALKNNEVAIDREFIKWARENYISQVDDYQFLRDGLDDTWIARNNLTIARRAKNGEGDNLNTPPPRPDMEPWIIETRDFKRVREHIIRTAVYSKYRFRPRVKLVDFHRKGSGEVELVIDDIVGRDIPLKTKTVAPTLYVYAQILDKPVSLESSQVVYKKEIDPRYKDLLMMYEELGWPIPDWLNNAIYIKVPLSERIRIVVAPNGEVKAYKITELDKRETDALGHPRDFSEEFDKDLTLKHAQYLDAYLVDLYLDDPKKLTEVFERNTGYDKIFKLHAIFDDPKGQAILDQMKTEILNKPDVVHLATQVPSVPRALEELRAALDRRTGVALNRAMVGGGGLINANGRLFLKALPSIPTLEFDYKFIEKKFENEEDIQPWMVDTNSRNSKNFYFVDKDEKGDSVVAPVDGNEGDAVWGPGRPKDSDGEGDGDGDNPNPKPGPQPGEQPMDPSWIEIPESMYAKLLGEKIKLPNLNPKKGESKNVRKIQRGKVNRRHGVDVTNDILINALKKGVAEQTDKNKDPMYDLTETLEDGLTLLNPRRDWVVKSIKTKPKPNLNAVVTFILDGSGSTQSFWESFKRMVFDLKVLIKHNYKSVDFRFIVFDSAAREVKEKDFFRIILGGGTDYSTAFEKNIEINEEFYPRSQWDRFTFFFGDMEDFSADKTINKLNELTDSSEYVGGVRGNDFGGLDSFLHSHMRTLSQDNPYVGYVDLGPRKDINIDDIKELLKNPKD